MSDTTIAMTAGAPVPPSPGGRARLISRILVIYCALMSLAVVWVVLFPPPPYDTHRPDFGVFWVASSMLPDRLDVIYDAHALTQAQAFIADPALGLMPWVYPPTALGLVAPFSALPFWTAFVVWNVLAALVYIMVARRVPPEGSLMVMGLVLASFSFWDAMKAGQLSPIISALIIGGVLVLGPRPVLAGVLIAAAGLVKPSLLVLAPVALIAGGHWRAFVAAGVTTLAAVGLTTALLGAPVWQAWLDAVRAFPAILVGLGIENHGVTLRAMLTEFGITGTAGDVVHGAGALLAVVLCALLFARRRDPVSRLVGLAGCALLVTPYAMKYDILMLLPVAGWLMVREKRTTLDWLLALAGFAFFFPIPPISGAGAVVFVLATAGALVLGRVDPWSRPPGTANFGLASARSSG